MDTIQNLLWIALLAGGIVLVVVIITVLLRLKKSIDDLLQEIHQIGQSTNPLVAKLEAAAEKADETLAIINENREALSTATMYLRRTAENIYRLENTFQVQIEPSVNALARRLMGLRRGIETFLDAMQGRR